MVRSTPPMIFLTSSSLNPGSHLNILSSSNLASLSAFSCAIVSFSPVDTFRQRLDDLKQQPHPVSWRSGGVLGSY
jgi:hypothetical protein